MFNSGFHAFSDRMIFDYSEYNSALLLMIMLDLNH